MSYSVDTLANAVYERIKMLDSSAEASLIPRIKASVPQAMEAVAIKVGGSYDKAVRNLLRKSFTGVSVASGSADLSTLLSGTQPILLDLIRTADIRHAGSSMKIQLLADRGSLAQDKPAAFLFGAVEGTTLYVPDATNGALTIIANYAEKSIANWKQQLEPMLFDELIGMHVRAVA